MGGLRMPSVRALGYDRLDTALPSWLTVTRGAGSWSRQTAAALDGTTFITTGTDQNTGRFSYVSAAARRMLLIEPTRTNLLLNGKVLDAAPNDSIPDGWAINGGAQGVDHTVDDTGAPDGGALVRWPDTGVAGGFSDNGLAALALVAHTWSGWFHRTAGAANNMYTFFTGGANPLVALDAGPFDWTRYTSTSTVTGASTTAYIQSQGVHPGVVRGADFQLEAGSYATSYIPSSGGALARAAELATVSTSVVGATSGFIGFNFAPEYANNTFATIHTLFEWAPNWRLDYNGGTDTFDVVVNGTIRATSAAQTFSAGQLYRLGVRYGAGGTVLTVDKAGSGAAQTSDTTAWGSPTLACYLGSRAASANCEGAAYSDWLSAA